ncbi:centrosomal protein of 104 kDa-like isoform X2 [Clavelina lepadiformis]|uniref:TOG domain-containing protein n=1 Tax=Clavelina lepadiformis TaxID=159417 RepID=A0ABP0F0Q3_CLALP
MPKKIGYTIVGVTGEAEGYSAKNLEHHGPTVPGWQTPRFCVYPQEIILHLHEPCHLKKLQILSHQYMIGSKVEFFVGSSGSPESFTRLGYIYLSNNEKTGFKSRELKSVHIDAEGQYLRLVVHKNHLNKYNLYNQVGIMAFNAIGDGMRTRRQPLHQLDGGPNNGTNYLNDTAAFNKPDYISPMDDLAFDMYQDPEVAGIIRRLDIKKKKAVIEENFDVAKRMKQAIADLQKVGEKLARYELDKRRAIEHEDYDLAKSKKAQMDEYRLKVYQQLQKHNLLEDAGLATNSPRREKGSPLKVAEEPQPSPREIAPAEEPLAEPPVQGVTPVIPQFVEHEYTPSPHPVADVTESVSYHESVEEEASMQHEHSIVNYDEKVIPALAKHKDRDPFSEEVASPPPVDSPEQTAPAGEPEAMSERNIREARSVIDVFDMPLVSGAYSKMWSYREDSLLAVYKLLSNVPAATSKDELKTTLRAAVFLIKRAIKDKVHAVFNASLKLLEYILVHFIPEHKLGKIETTYTVAQTLPNLIQKTGETALRSRSSALDFIDSMSAFKTVHPLQLVQQQAIQPYKRDLAMRLALSRVELVKRLLDRYGIQPPALTVDTVMKFVNPALEHASGSVREEATKVILQLYRIGGAPVKAYLPTDDNFARKNPLYRHIFDEMDHIDGKPTQSELKAQMQAKTAADEQAKRQQIAELQAQVEQLRAVNAKTNETQSPPTKQGKKTKKNTVRKDLEADLIDQKQGNVSADADDTFLENMCIFCSEKDDSFTEEGLDLHYWKHCPMLKRCEHCKQVVEIAGYSEHLLTECDSKDNFGKCPRCTEAILKVDLQKHIADKKCTAAKPTTQDHCPLCHRNITQGEESWKNHLMGSKRDACQSNPRRLPSINRLRGKEESEKNAAAGKGKKLGPVKHVRK